MNVRNAIHVHIYLYCSTPHEIEYRINSPASALLQYPFIMVIVAYDSTQHGAILYGFTLVLVKTCALHCHTFVHCQTFISVIPKWYMIAAQYHVIICLYFVYMGILGYLMGQEVGEVHCQQGEFRHLNVSA